MKKLLVILLLFFPVHGAWAEESLIIKEDEHFRYPFLNRHEPRTEGTEEIFGSNKFNDKLSCQKHIENLFEWYIDLKVKKKEKGFSYIGSLFPNDKIVYCNDGNPPSEWIEEIKPINKYAITKFNANIRRFPLVGSTTGKYVGIIPKGKKIFIIDKVKNSDTSFDAKLNPVYRYWYSFMDQGKKYWIWMDSVNLEK